jgi:LuxR family maltose regulon positive regulatory protein
MGLGELWREWNDLDRAQECIQQGIELTNLWSDVAALEGYLTLARIKQARGDEEAATQAVASAQELASRFAVSDWDDLIVAAFQALIWLAQGNEQAVQQWAERRGLTDRAPDSDQPSTSDAMFESQLRRHEEMVLARLFLRQGLNDRALDLLESLLPLAEAQGRVSNIIEIRILRALAWEDVGQVEGALGELEQALAMAEPGGYMRIFLDEGLPMARLLYQAAQQGVQSEYAARLLAAFPADQSGEMSPIQESPADIVEPLSDRELEVLKLIAAGLSNREIAQRLFLSISTVKVHIYNLYGKLGVHSRTQAVHRATALGILPPL